MQYDLRILTNTQLVRLYHELWHRMTRGDGYQPFGYDRVTLLLTKSGWMSAIDAVKAEWFRR